MKDAVEGTVLPEDVPDLVHVPQVGVGVGDPLVRLGILQAIETHHSCAPVGQVAGEDAAEITRGAGHQDAGEKGTEREARVHDQGSSAAAAEVRHSGASIPR